MGSRGEATGVAERDAAEEMAEGAMGRSDTESAAVESLLGGTGKRPNRIPRSCLIMQERGQLTDKARSDRTERRRQDWRGKRTLAG